MTRPFFFLYQPKTMSSKKSTLLRAHPPIVATHRPSRAPLLGVLISAYEMNRYVTHFYEFYRTIVRPDTCNAPVPAGFLFVRLVSGDLGGFPGCGVRGVRDVCWVPVSACALAYTLGSVGLASYLR